MPIQAKKGKAFRQFINTTKTNIFHDVISMCVRAYACLRVCVFVECWWGGGGMVGCFCTCMCIYSLFFVCPFKVNYTNCLLLYFLSNVCYKIKTDKRLKENNAFEQDKVNSVHNSSNRKNDLSRQWL